MLSHLERRINFKGDIIMFEKLKNILVEELSINPDDITPEAELTNDLGINSLELADLVLMCEEEFGVEFNEDDMHKFITVGDVANFLEETVK
jgi:acyl carrier protein